MTGRVIIGLPISESGSELGCLALGVTPSMGRVVHVGSLLSALAATYNLIEDGFPFTIFLTEICFYHPLCFSD